MKYYINKRVSGDFETVEKRLIEVLKNEGFGVISDIDIQEKLKEKLGIAFRKYKILGACNPEYAYKALQNEDKIGTMLPCNVIIQEAEKSGIEVSAVDPVASMMAIENDNLAHVAAVIRNKLARVINDL